MIKGSGVKRRRAGYVVSKHNSNNYEHRAVVESVLGRKLRCTEIVHHIDYNKLNNDKSNLVVCTQQYHRIIHARTDAILVGFDPDTHSLCSDCGTYKLKSDFPKSASRWNGLSNQCKYHANLRRRGGKYYHWGEKERQQQRNRRAAARLLKEGK